MEEVGKEHWQVGLWVALAIDESRVSTPRTQSNKKAFSAKRYGKGKNGKIASKLEEQKEAKQEIVRFDTR